MARPRKVWPSLCCIVCDIKLLYRQSLFPKQAAGRVYVDLFDLPQLLHGSSLFLWGDRGTDHAVDHGLEGIRRQSVQIQEVLLTDIPQESGDLGVIHHARQRDALSGGEDQRVEPHGHHRLHPGKRADDGPGAAGIVRVPWNDPVIIKAILDMGADGIVVPMVC